MHKNRSFEKDNPGPTIFISAGESSGDFIGASLIRQLRKKYPGLVLIGIGGQHMQSEGLDSLFPMEELSVMGFLEVLPHLLSINKRMKQSIQFIKEKKPDIIVTIDAPGFHFALIKRLKKKLKNAPPCIHYVAPTVWAWKEKRAQKISYLYDHVLTLFPFEPPCFQKYGLNATFVGHPLIEAQLPQEEDLRKVYDIPENANILTVLPGSRRQELKKLMPVFHETVCLLANRIKHLYVFIPTLPHLCSELEKMAAHWPVPTVVASSEHEKRMIFKISQVALAASGTVSLELALAKTPMVIAYRVGFISGWLAQKLIKIPFVCLVNILLNKPSVPEALQKQCNPLYLVELVHKLFFDKQSQKKQINDFNQIHSILSANGVPSVLAANVISSYLERSCL